MDKIIYNLTIVNKDCTMNLKLELKQLGFKKKEREILNYLYSKGKSKASQIANQLNQAKSTILYVLYKLEKKGFVEKKKKGKSYLFTSTDPTVFLRYFDERIRKEKRKKSRISSLIPDIRRLKDQKADAQISFYHTESSIGELRKSLYDQLDNKDISLIYDKDKVKIFSNEDYHFLITNDLAVRFEDRETLVKFVHAFKYINSHEIKK